MKNISIIFIACLFLQFTSLAQEGWQLQTSNTTAGLRSVSFINSDIGWAVGRFGTILKTTNGGLEWNLQDSPIGGEFASVFISNANTAWIVGGLSGLDLILKTTNGGEDWLIKQNDKNGCLNIDVYFIDENIGWVIGTWGIWVQHPLLQKTTDGGESWIEISELSGTALQFIDSTLGWYVNGYITGSVSGSGSIHKTTDGGQTFIEQLGGDSLAYLSDVCFINNNIGWAVGHFGTILNTTSGGDMWNMKNLGNDIGCFSSVDFVDENYGWAVGGLGIIYNTTDGGEFWVEQESGTTELLSAVDFVDKNTGWIVGSNGLILKYQGVNTIEEDEVDATPNKYFLSNNYPNPFNPSTNIIYSIQQLSNVIIKVYDILGNEIETLVNEEKPAGSYEITWYAEGVPNGIYFYQLKAGSFVETKKMILLK
jgi:photosystem II stability/assembly factor-like uncharacterized protein